MSSQHFQNYIFGTYPIWELSSEFNPPHFWHFNVKRFPGCSHGNINSTCTHRKHTHTSIRTCMTVGTNQRFSWLRQSLHMNWVAHPVTWRAIMKAESS